MKTFVTIIIILLLIRWFLKPFIKFTVNTSINKMAEEARKHQQQFEQKQKKSEGTISVDYIPTKGKQPPKNNAGDYVDYEEIN
jgi:hypothetical protein